MGAMLLRTTHGKHRGHGPLLQAGRRCDDYSGGGATPRAA
jgi:hypothetical protein